MSEGIQSVCIDASSSDAISPQFFPACNEFGKLLAEKGWTLVFGGGNVGLMNEVASAVKNYGGYVVGVIPELLHEKDLTFTDADEVIITKDMRTRKAEMETRSDADIAFPGGFGTLEEILEVLTLKQLHQHNKPIIIFNDQNHFDHLIEQFEEFYNEEFAKEKTRSLYFVAQNVAEMMEYLENYIPP